MTAQQVILVGSWGYLAGSWGGGGAIHVLLLCSDIMGKKHTKNVYLLMEQNKFQNVTHHLKTKKPH